MAGGSQDLLQPNNLALSWCKYTSTNPLPSLKACFSKTCCPRPLLPPPTKALLMSHRSHTHTHTLICSWWSIWQESHWWWSLFLTDVCQPGAEFPKGSGPADYWLTIHMSRIITLHTLPVNMVLNTAWGFVVEIFFGHAAKSEIWEICFWSVSVYGTPDF